MAEVATRKRGHRNLMHYVALGKDGDPDLGDKHVEKGLIIPLLAGFRVLLEAGPDGDYGWAEDPIAFFHRNGTMLIRRMMLLSDERQNNPHLVGRDRSVYQSVYELIELTRFREAASSGTPLRAPVASGPVGTAPEPSPAQVAAAAAAARQFRGRRAKGAVAPHAAYCRPILEALVRRGGAAAKSAVIGLVGESVASILTKEDWRPLRDGSITWENKAAWTRQFLVDAGLLSGDSPRGVLGDYARGAALARKWRGPAFDYPWCKAIQREKGRADPRVARPRLPQGHEPPVLAGGPFC